MCLLVDVDVAAKIAFMSRSQDGHMNVVCIYAKLNHLPKTLRNVALPEEQFILMKCAIPLFP